ncbi:scyllo-inositol 2-dehydrogenase (NADP+) [Sphingomonas gellani]|uniref:Scyllo-inositol 2-dehydrogenase (NADP+) n=1 Tax=Sphingomonas gellani TaxID=1166340 RepID=A0A1H7ZH02_9SPHN|nr:Gfo/Idh/MocA family oxidoreductase [Sphingomonas gellani]SEM57531.1 scyllo-inositol 2-dehydrogenase (NADP+) [Sphingomonas gellani]
MSDTTGVGLVGFGLAGARLHAPVIAAVPGFRIAAIMTSRREEAHADWPDAAVVGTPDDLLARPDVDLIVVATPNATHAPIAAAALRAGKHVVVDKPFVTDNADGDALIEAAREAGLVLSVYQNRRWDADFLTVGSLLAGGRLGQVRLAEMCWHRFRPAIKPGWRERERVGGGLLADLGPHLIDQALQLFGIPDAVGADVLIQRPQAVVDDYFDVVLHYGGMRVRLASSTLVAATRPRFALHGDAGSFVKHGIDPQEAALRAGHIDWASFGQEEPALHGTLTDPDGRTMAVPSERGDWRCFYRGMLNAIRGEAPPPVIAEDALLALRIVELARTAAEAGRVLPVDPSLVRTGSGV